MRKDLVDIDQIEYVPESGLYLKFSDGTEVNCDPRVFIKLMESLRGKDLASVTKISQALNPGEGGCASTGWKPPKKVLPIWKRAE